MGFRPIPPTRTHDISPQFNDVGLRQRPPPAPSPLDFWDIGSPPDDSPRACDIPCDVLKGKPACRSLVPSLGCPFERPRVTNRNPGWKCHPRCLLCNATKMLATRLHAPARCDIWSVSSSVSMLSFPTMDPMDNMDPMDTPAPASASAPVHQPPQAFLCFCTLCG